MKRVLKCRWWTSVCAKKSRSWAAGCQSMPWVYVRGPIEPHVHLLWRCRRSWAVRVVVAQWLGSYFLSHIVWSWLTPPTASASHGRWAWPTGWGFHVVTRRGPLSALHDCGAWPPFICSWGARAWCSGSGKLVSACWWCRKEGLVQVVKVLVEGCSGRNLEVELFGLGGPGLSGKTSFINQTKTSKWSEVNGKIIYRSKYSRTLWSTVKEQLMCLNGVYVFEISQNLM